MGWMQQFNLGVHTVIIFCGAYAIGLVSSVHSDVTLTIIASAFIAISFFNLQVSTYNLVEHYEHYVNEIQNELLKFKDQEIINGYVVDKPKGKNEP